MNELTIQLPADQHDRLKAMAVYRNTTLEKLFEDLAGRAITQFDAEMHFRARAARGDPEQALKLLDRLDKHFADRSD